MRMSASRRIQFCAGHRVFNHEGKCANLHGHNYVVIAKAEADGLDPVGRVVDFSVIKEKLGGWIEKNWDHGFIYYGMDSLLVSIFTGNGLFNGRKSYDMPSNPTAENMAEFLLYSICPQLFLGSAVRITKITLWETENCFAEAEVSR